MEPHTTFKVCRDCGIEKPVSEFSPSKQIKDGLHSYCKPCNAARARAWQKANPEKVAATVAEYRAVHEEEIAVQMADYYIANREQKLAYLREWREANPDYQREWCKANPEKHSALTRNYRARKANASGYHTAEDVQVQYDHQKGHCHYCGVRVGDGYHVDHVVPLSEGGSNWPENLVIACPTCNLSKHNKHPMDFAGILF